MTRIVSLLQEQITIDLVVELVTRKQALLNAIDMNRTSSIECDRHERNKLCYMRVAGTNQKTTIDLID